MKIENIIRRVLREEQEEQILMIPGFRFFNNDWNILQKFLESQGNTKCSMVGDMDLRNTDIKSLGNLVRVEGSLDLNHSNIESLGSLEYVDGYLSLYFCENLESLGNLEYVDGDLYLDADYIKTLESLGNLNYVGGSLYWRGCDYDTKEVEEVVWVRDQLYL
jgi:hypothetical protein